MQAPAKGFRIFIVALIASLALGACGGGTSGKTWFNLPSVGLDVQPDNSVKVLGYNAGPVVPPALLDQLKAANVQKLEARVGYNGVHVYNNGADLPYLSWDADAVAALQEVVRSTPNLPNRDLIANALPWLRTFGIGVALNLPGADSVQRWTGETAITPEQPESTIGPIKVSGIALDDAGTLYVSNIPGDQLGLAGPVVDAGTLGLLQSLGLEKLQITTNPNGIALSMNDRPLPGVAYDSGSLAALQPLLGALAPDQAGTLDTALTTLQSTQLEATVSFNGPTAGELQLGTIPVKLNSDGTLSAYGAPLPGVTLPADLMQKLGQAGVQTLNVDVDQEGLFLAANGQTLPTITWTPESLALLAGVVAPIAGVDAGMIDGLLGLIMQSGGLQANIGVGESEPVDAEIDRTMQAAAAEGAPILRLNANVENGTISSIEGLGSLADLGIDPIVLPPNVVQILSQLNASQVTINTDPNKVDILLDGNTALTINWDVPSIQAALQLAGPFLAGTPLEDPNVAQLVNETVVPLLPSADVDVTLNLN